MPEWRKYVNGSEAEGSSMEGGEGRDGRDGRGASGSETVRSRLRRILPVLCVMGLLVWLPACDSEGDAEEMMEVAPPPVSPEPVTLRAPASLPGDLLLDEGLLRFQACGQADAQPVDDETGGMARQILDELGYGDDRVRVAAVLDGARLLEIRYASPEESRCQDLLPDAHLEARGNEPFWNVQVRGTEAVWRTPEIVDKINYFDGGWEGDPEGELIFEARRDGVDGVEYLRLRITPEECRDTMAGAYFPFTARVELGGQEWVGCALEGTRAFVSP
jgi:uncharacterized membrane protein